MIERLFNDHCLIFYKIILLCFCFLLTSVSSAKDLGVVGQVYPIKEMDLLEFIQHKIVAMQKNGEWEKIQKQWKERVAKQADRPFPVPHIQKTRIAKSWKYDPSLFLPYDLTDGEGNIFAKAGTRINPLSMLSLHTALVFYDAEDKGQVEWVKKTNKEQNGKIKLVLVNGSISEQEKIFQKPIYFDQKGKLTTHFSIQHVPALVYQKELELVVSEIIP